MLLNCHTYYSLNYGAKSPHQLVELALNLKHSKIILADINNTSAAIEVARIAKDNKLSISFGVDIRNGIDQQYVAIAKNQAGYFAINQHVSTHFKTKRYYEPIAPNLPHTHIIYPFEKGINHKLKENEWIGISINQLQRWLPNKWEPYLPKLVLLQTATFEHKRDFNAHRLLRAIEENTLLSKLKKEQQALETDTYYTATEVAEILKNYPQQITANTRHILNTSQVEFDFESNKNKVSYGKNKAEDDALLTKLTYEGILYRYPKSRPDIIARIEKELKVIKELHFCAYFLINWDMINYAKSKGYHHVGRGSGANSLVAYLIGITDVDPIELDLFFERFINPYRLSPPDFDIDFSWTDRDDVTQYLFGKYGKERTALLGTYITYQKKAVIRELGKVFGMPSDEIKQLQRTRRSTEQDKYGKWVLGYSNYIAGFPSHLSVHSSGIIISEEPIYNYTATFMPPKGFETTHFDMHVAEDIHLNKYDILSQRGIGKIKDAQSMVLKNHGVSIDIHQSEVFKQDKQVKLALRTSKVVGCFYIESPAMRMLLTKLHADDYNRLVAASSIIRPGVAKSGMMREYILRYQNPKLREKARAENPVLYDLLADTFGVMVYQEDVLKVAHEFAGLSLSEADVMRRGMSWKYKERSDFKVVKEKFFDNCIAKGHHIHVVQKIWTQIESFANYAFAKGHSASYAVESFQALYLKTHYPAEYMCATLNNGGGFYNKGTYIHEALMCGVKTVLPCINKSTWKSTVSNHTIQLGLSLIQGIELKEIKDMLHERQQGGEFTNLKDVIKRSCLSINMLQLLIRVGAMRMFNPNKKELLWQLHMLKTHDKPQPTKSMFEIEQKNYAIPTLVYHDLDDAYDEIELLGFSLTISPFKLLTVKPKNMVLAKDFKTHLNKNINTLGLLVHVKRTSTSNGKTMYFGTFLDEEGNWIDSVHFPSGLNNQQFTGPGCYVISGKVTSEFGFISIACTKLQRVPIQNLE